MTRIFLRDFVPGMAFCLLALLSFTCQAQLKFSQLPYYGPADTGSYCVGVQNGGGVFTNKRFRIPSALPTLSSVLSTGNTANTSLHIHTATNDLFIDNTYFGFLVKYGTTNMAGLRSYYGTTGILDLYASSHTASLLPNLSMSADRTLYLPNADGTLALTSQLPVMRIKTLSGDGIHDSLSFTAPGTGTMVQCQSTNNLAQVKFSFMSGTTVTVKFTSAPPTGTNNVSVAYWFQ